MISLFKKAFQILSSWYSLVSSLYTTVSQQRKTKKIIIWEDDEQIPKKFIKGVDSYVIEYRSFSDVIKDNFEELTNFPEVWMIVIRYSDTSMVSNTEKFEKLIRVLRLASRQHKKVVLFHVKPRGSKTKRKIALIDFDKYDKVETNRSFKIFYPKDSNSNIIHVAGRIVDIQCLEWDRIMNFGNTPCNLVHVPKEMKEITGFLSTTDEGNAIYTQLDLKDKDVASISLPIVPSKELIKRMNRVRKFASLSFIYDCNCFVVSQHELKND